MKSPIDRTQEKLNQTVVPAGPIFNRHESFHPRFGWLKKGFDKATLDPEIFLREDAPIILGVGKNMVKSIRYWCSAFKVLEEYMVSNKGARLCRPTEFGKRLLGGNGWDPFLENNASLWLLHWYLLNNPCQATTWEFAFNKFRRMDIYADEFTSSLKEYIEQEYPRTTISESSLNRDFSCLTRMYVEHRTADNIKEDTLNSPFSELGLMQSVERSKKIQFVIGAKPDLVPEIVVAACLEYAAGVQQGARTIALSRLLYDTGSPGLVFKLTESSLRDAIEAASTSFKEVSLSDTAGIIQFSFSSDPSRLSLEILDNYYKKSNETRRF